MNERIRELAEQAIIAVDNHTLIEEEELKKMYIPDCFLEKFAEYIVRECAGACLHDDWEDPRWGRFYANKIREHFAIR